MTLRSWNSERSVAWADLSEVRLVDDPRRTLVLYARDADRIRSDRRAPGVGERQASSVAGADRALAVSFPHLTGDPGRLAEAIDHWRRRSADRVELGTPAARARLGRVPEEPGG